MIKMTHWFLGIFLMFSMSLSAQLTSVEYTKALDYCTCEIALSYAQDYVKTRPGSSEKTSFDSVVKSELESCTITDPIPNATLFKLLSDNNFGVFSENLSPVMAELLNNYKETQELADPIGSLLSDIYESKAMIDIVKQYPNVGTLKEGLEADLRANFQPVENTKVEEDAKVVSTVDPTLDSSNSKGSKTNFNGGNTERSSFSFNWFPLGLFLVSLLLLFLLYRYFDSKIKDVDDDLKTVKHGDENPNYLKNKVFHAYKNDAEKRISDLNAELSKLQNELHLMVSKSEPSAVQTTHQSPPVTQVQNTPPPVVRHILYAPIPNGEDYFLASTLSKDAKEGKYYKFELDPEDQNLATFEFFNTENSAKRATNSPELFLYPACTSLTSLNQNATSIITVTPGKAKMQGEQWIVIQKAEIKYG